MKSNRWLLILFVAFLLISASSGRSVRAGDAPPAAAIRQGTRRCRDCRGARQRSVLA